MEISSTLRAHRSEQAGNRHGHFNDQLSLSVRELPLQSFLVLELSWKMLILFREQYYQ